METRAIDDIEIGEDLTPPLPPLAFSLLDSSLLSRCSTCFSPLSPPPHHLPDTPLSLLYCSPRCSASDSLLHFSSAEHHLLHLLRHRRIPPQDDTSDLRLSLRLLRYFEQSGLVPEEEGVVATRIAGLMTNRDGLMSRESDEECDEVSEKIRIGAKAMAMARRSRDGDEVSWGFFSANCAVEESVLCLVLTNAVEICNINGRGGAIGIAVYGTIFSWINHSCSPNACYRFSMPPHSGGDSRLRISPAATETDDYEIDLEHEFYPNKCILLTENEGCGYGPRIVVRSIKAIEKGEEVSIAYTDLLQPKETRQSELWLKYRFICCCKRCSASSPTYADQVLQEIYTSDPNSVNSISDHSINKLKDYINDAINEFLSSGNPEPCCQNLESVLTQGFFFDDKKLFLHPLHHLSLNTYTTLSSAYKTRSSLNSSMIRKSAAYSLLLSVAAHNLFLSESSLISSVSNFWTNTGELLLEIAQISRHGFNPKFKFDSFFRVHRAKIEFLDFISSVVMEVWSFLVEGVGGYLETVKDPFDFGRGRASKGVWCKPNKEEEVRVSMYWLGVHCLSYGVYLSSVCCGQDYDLSTYVQNLMFG